MKFAISVQNLAEFFNIITKKIKSPLTAEIARKTCQEIIAFSGFEIYSYDEKTLEKAMFLFSKNKGYFWDTILVATMLENNISRIITENVKDFEKYSEINVVNPF